jgi:GntR family transcriptional regulator
MALDQARRLAPAGAREPKYYGLKRHLTELAGSLPPGTAVPPERTLAVDFGTSRTTVRQALQQLVAEGRLERFQGRGTFVARPKLAQSLQLTSYTQDVRAHGLEPTSRTVVLEQIRADEELAARLAVRPGERVIHLERVRLADGEPLAIERTYLSAARFPGLRRHLTRLGSLYAALGQEYGVHPAEAEETIETALATPDEGALLGVDTGLPLLVLWRHSRDAEGTPVEWVRSAYRGDRVRFVATLRRPDGSQGSG